MQGRLVTWTEVRRFALAGNATFTLVSGKTGTRFTYRISVPRNSKNPSGVGPYFVSLLRGPDNNNDYAYMGVLNLTEPMTLKSTMASRVKPDAKSHVAFRWFLRQLCGGGEMPTDLEVWHEGRCGRCGRKLTVPESVASGLGPECAGRMQ